MMWSILRLVLQSPSLLFQKLQVEPDMAPPSSQVETDADPSNEAPPSDGLGGAAEETSPHAPVLEPLPDPVPDPVLEPQPELLPLPEPTQRTTDPIEALGETAETAGEAATDFISWVGSGHRDALIALALVIGLTVFQWMLRLVVLRGIVRLPSIDDNSITALIQRVVSQFHLYAMFAIALTVTDAVLVLPDRVSGFVKILFVLAAVLQVAEWVQEFAVSAIRRTVQRNTGDARALASAFNIIKWFISFVVWSVALLLILDNVGADVTALLAGLGIGGIAIGIAAQGVFRDLFSSLSIVIDKPFQIGDTIRYGDSWGAIEEIGLKSTRIRAKSGEQLIISNTNLLDFEIHNMQRMTRRRMQVEFGVVYQTEPNLAAEIPGIVADIVKGVQGVEFDRCGMAAFGPSSLDYELVFFSLNPEFNRSMAARSRVLLALLAAFRHQQIEFAYPTQTLYVEGLPGRTAEIPNDKG